MKLIASRPADADEGASGHSEKAAEAAREPEGDSDRDKAMMDAIVDSAPSAFTLVDPELKLVRWNRYVRDQSGRSDDELRGASVLSLIHKDYRAAAQASLLTAFATGYARMEVRVPADERHVFLTTARRLVVGEQAYVAAFCTDITDRKEAERALAENKVFIDTLIDSLPGAFYVIDAEGNYSHCWNGYLNKLTGLSDPEIDQRNSLLIFQDSDRPHAAAMMKEAFETDYAKGTLRVASASRGARPFLMTMRRFQVNDVRYLAVVGIDTTEEVAATRELEHEARTDPLTQISNRGHFMGMAHREFARCRRYGHSLSVWMLDIDHFKSVNDTWGHPAGDAVLRSLAVTTQQALRDWDIVGRIGGEEFAVLLPGTDERQAMLVAERLRQAVRDSGVPIASDAVVHVTVSAGITAMRDDDADVQAVLARADEALYEAKRTGRDKVCLV